MTRQVFLVFFGEARWQDDPPTAMAAPRSRRATAERPRTTLDPHESPWTDDAARSSCWPSLPSSAACSTCPFTATLQLPRALARARRSSAHEAHARRAPAAPRSALAVVAVVAARRRHRRRLPRATCRQRDQGRSSPSVLAHAWYVDEAIAAVVGGPGRGRLRRRRLVVDRKVIDGAVNGVGDAGAHGRRPACAACRPATCATTPSASPSAPSLLLAWFVIAGGRLMQPSVASGALPAAHRRSSCCPPSARWSSRSLPKAPARARPAGRRCCSPVATGALASTCWSSSRPAEAGFQFVDQHSWIERLRHLVAPRRRRHLAVPRRAHRRAVPARDRSAPTPAPRRQAVLRLAAAARGRLHGMFLALDLFLFFVFFEIVLVPMYFLIGGWGYGDRVYAATEVLPLHDARLGVHARRHPGPGVPARSGDGHAHLRPRRRSPTSSRSPPAPARWLFLGLRRRLRGEGAAVPVAHLAARRPHRGADRRLGDPGRRHAEAGHLRVPALRRSTCSPRRPSDFAPVLRHARRDRHHLRRHRAPRCRRTSSGWWPTRRWPTSASSCWARSPSRPRASPGGVLQMVNHGISTGALFLLVGMIYERRHTREIAELQGPAEGRRRSSPACSRVVMLGVDRPARPQRLRRRVPDPARRRSSPAGGGRSWPPPA